MRYTDGEPVRLGDWVELKDGSRARLVNDRHKCGRPLVWHPEADRVSAVYMSDIVRHWDHQAN